MKIPIISTIKTGLKQYVKTIDYRLRPNRNFELSENFDTFSRRKYPDFIYNVTASPIKMKTRIYGEQLLDSVSEVTPEFYKSLSPKKLKAIRVGTAVNIANRAAIIENIAQIIKNIFDNRFGKDSYVFISVGRSLSATAKCLEFMGVETRQLPFSGVHNSKIVDVDKIISQRGFNKYVDFLYEQGLDNKSKKHIFCDYCFSGETLRTFKEIIEAPEVGLKSKNNIFININKALHCVEEKHPRFSKPIEEFLSYLNGQFFDNVANIGRLSIRHLSNVKSALTPEVPEYTKLLNFSLLDILNLKKK